MADKAGFCFGVERAVNTVYEQLERGKPIYTYGPIVHNEEVVAELESRGVRVIEGPEDLRKMQPEEGAVVIVRAHGIPEETYRIFEEKHLEVVDATCPFVRKIHQIAIKAGEDGETLLIAGNPNHPEVEGIVGWAKGEVHVIEDPEKAENLEFPAGEKLRLVAQTTYQLNKFKQIVDIFKKKGYDVNVVSTICNATQERQQSARALAREVDCMVVIGGKNSSNTRKLYEICKEECDLTFYIQTLDDLNLELPKSVRTVGITAGASTPKKIIEEVQNNVRGIEF
jgi:4-hydroxy-3-methylbut-2-enyl diphosphate reductase